MKRLASFMLAGLLCALAAPAIAQTVPVQLSWSNPTASKDGVPLTGGNALTGIEVHWATAPIADVAECALPCTGARAPQVTLGVVSASTQTINATNGSTLHFRLRALNSGGKSAFSNEATKLVSLSTIPLPPTQLRVDIVLSLLEDGSYTMAMAVREAWEETIYGGG